MFGADAIRCMRRDSGATGDGHVYWRINVLSTNTTTVYSVRLGEVGFIESAGGGSVSIGGIASAKTRAAPNEAANAFDGNLGTVWLSYGAMPQWIMYEHPYPVACVEVLLGSGGSSARMPTEFTVDYSDDGVEWTTAATFTDYSLWTTGETRIYSLA